jgi:uncharacterized repeat protein (TIGR01451 family)
MKHNKQLMHILAVIVLLVSMLFGGAYLRTATAATALEPGDIAIIGFSFDTNDFAFVLLVDIEEGTEIRFTDAGWQADQTFFTGEGAVTYTAPQDLPAGTVLSYLAYIDDFVVTVEGPFTRTTGFAFTNAGDQIFAFQGTYENPTFLFGLNNSSNGWTGSPPNALNTTLPPTLTEGYTAIWFDRSYENGVYTGPLTGTQEELLAAISDPDNWNYTNSSVTMPSTDFEIDPGPPAVDATIPASGAVNVLRDSQIEIQFNKDVNVDGLWFAIECSGRTITATVSGGPQEYTLQPDEPFLLDDVCTVTVIAESVSDNDDPPRYMEEDYLWTFYVLQSQVLNVGFSSNSPVVLGEQAEFTNSTTGEETIAYLWDFGDGETSTSDDPVHDYAAAGTYQVTLTATNDYGEDYVTHDFVVLTPPVISVEKSVDPEAEVEPGATVTYTIVITNSGQGTAVGVELTDTLPEEVSFVEQISGPDLDVDGNDLSWMDNIPGGGSVTFVFTAEVDDDVAVYGETISNTAYVTSTNAGEDASSASFLTVPEPLVVSFTSNSPVVLGRTSIFTNTTTGEPPVSYEWDFGDGSDISTETSPEHVYAAAGSYEVTLTATNDYESDSFTATHIVLTPPVVTVDKSVAPQEDVLLGGTVTYTITLENTGQGTASGVELTDTLPEGLSFSQQISGPGLTVDGNDLSWMGNINGRSMVAFIFTAEVDDDETLYSETITNTAYISSTNAGEDESSASFTITPGPLTAAFTSNSPVVLGQTSIFTNATRGREPITYEWDFGDGSAISTEANPAHTYAESGSYQVTLTATNGIETSLFSDIHVVLDPAALTITKSVNPEEAVALGGQVVYTITLTNHGDVDALDVVLTDVLPNSLEVVSVDGGGSATGNTVSWTGNIPGQSNKTIVITATLSTNSSLFGQAVDNTALFTSSNAGEGQASATFQVEEAPRIYMPLIFGSRTD